MNASSLQGRSVFVTGGSKGIGKGIALVFAKAKANVTVVARSESDASKVADEIAIAGGRAIAVAADVRQRESIEKAIARTIDAFGGIDVCCANAGIFPSARLESMSIEQWDQVIDTNLKGMFLTVQACIPSLKDSAAGRVILTSSITGPITGYPGWTHYAASKAGMLGFMRTACMELARYGITVNAVLPGNIVTEGLLGMGQQYMDKMARAIPLKRLGSVEDIGYAALFLASKEAGYITGHSIVVDGGQTLPESIEAVDA